jgi:hypothetical protein
MIISNDQIIGGKKTRFKVYMMFNLAWTNLVSYLALKLLGHHRHTYMQSMDQNLPPPKKFPNTPKKRKQ